MKSMRINCQKLRSQAFLRSTVNHWTQLRLPSRSIVDWRVKQKFQLVSSTASLQSKLPAQYNFSKNMKILLICAVLFPKCLLWALEWWPLKKKMANYWRWGCNKIKISKFCIQPEFQGLLQRNRAEAWAWLGLEKIVLTKSGLISWIWAKIKTNPLAECWRRKQSRLFACRRLPEDNDPLIISYLFLTISV